MEISPYSFCMSHPVNEGLILPKVNFNNILQATIFYENVIHIFSVRKICVCIFWQKEFGKKLLLKY